MKTQETVQPELATLDTWVEGRPFQITGDYEAVADQLPRADAYIKHMAGSAAVTAVEAPRTVQEPKPEHVSLADLNAREIARLERKAVWHDIKTLGRTSMHKLFIQKLHEEQDARTMMELGIVEAVHCRLHEKVVAKARGLV